MAIATGDAVILLDGDLQDPPELIEPFFENGSRATTSSTASASNGRRPGSCRSPTRRFYRVFSATSYVPIPLDAGDFSLIDRRVVDALNALPENNRFLRGLRAWVGFRQTGVPYVRPERMFGHDHQLLAAQPRVGPQGHPVVLLRALGSDHGPGDRDGRRKSPSGIALEIVVRLFRPDLVPRGFTTVIVLILFLGGIQLPA